MGYVKKEGSSWMYVTELGKDPGTGKRKRKRKRGFKTKRDAEKALSVIEAQIYEGTYLEPSKKLYKDYLLNDWFRMKRASIGEQTIGTYMTVVHKHIIPNLGHMPMSTIHPSHIQNFIHGLSEKDYKGRTVKKVHEVIRSSLEHAVSLDIIPKNVAAKVKLPRIEDTEMEVWDDKSMTSFLKTAETDRYYMAFYIALTTGMRQGEILGLRWKDIDFEKKSLSIYQTLRHDGKGFLSGGKTKASQRTIELSKETVQTLKKHKKTMLKEKLQAGGEYEDLDLVICTGNGKPVNPANIRRSFNRLMKKAVVPKITFHGLRHTHATFLLSRDVNPKVIAERLGHTDIRITMNTYSHVLPTMQKVAVTQIDSLLSSN
ncbi:site-specific integrase [Halobacillus sp. Nhm2S1]|uniref:tyrosine-type recombinase/integrase n=1 Tax=Halobacillus sp. Nhm2S1 TaxID=2866716 RepID=UPI002107F66A|nr:site-specific integrase [Halobacillus sp. Nhm2S1]